MHFHTFKLLKNIYILSDFGANMYGAPPPNVMNPMAFGGMGGPPPQMGGPPNGSGNYGAPPQVID